MLEYGLYRLIIFHAILKLTLEYFSVQTCLLSAVLFLFFDFLKELVWLLNLALIEGAFCDPNIRLLLLVLFSRYAMDMFKDLQSRNINVDENSPN